jgi:hypothetical protein
MNRLLFGAILLVVLLVLLVFIGQLTMAASYTAVRSISMQPRQHHLVFGLGRSKRSSPLLLSDSPCEAIAGYRGLVYGRWHTLLQETGDCGIEDTMERPRWSFALPIP